jgi:hypothetical protein
MEGFKTETKEFKKADYEFFKQFKLTNFNFDVQIHRKEGGPVIYQTFPRSPKSNWNQKSIRSTMWIYNEKIWT